MVFFKKVMLVAIAILLLIPFIGIYVKGLDETTVIMNDYLLGKEYGLIKITVKTPNVKADWCTVSIRKFHTGINNSLSITGFGKTRPGGSIVISDSIKNAIPVAYKMNEKNGDLKIVYRKPQEYFVTVKCYKKLDERRVSLVGYYARTIEVFPRKPIWKVFLDVKDVNLTKVGDKNIDRLSNGGSPFAQCNFDNNVCTAPTKIAEVNSIPGIVVKYRLYSYPVHSAIYLSSQHKECIQYDLLTCKCLEWGSWSESGKVRTVSLVTQTTPNSVSNGEKGKVVGIVRYKQEYWPGTSDSFSGVCWDGPSWTIYPETIGALWPILISQNSYSPPSTIPNYAYGPTQGDLEITYGEYGAHMSNYKLGVSTAISFCGAGGAGCVTLNINLYKAGRNDAEYTTPTLLVHDTSNKNSPWFYWWFKNDDPMTYDIQFHG